MYKNLDIQVRMHVQPTGLLDYTIEDLLRITGVRQHYFCDDKCKTGRVTRAAGKACVVNFYKLQVHGVHKTSMTNCGTEQLNLCNSHLHRIKSQ